MPGPYVSPVAESIPYNDTIQTPLSGADNVQDILDYLKQLIVSSASPGFTWGRSGNGPASTWLQNETVPSNISGRTVFLNNALIRKVFVANQSPNILKIGVYVHDGDSTNIALVGVVTTLAQRSNEFDVSWAVTRNKQIALKIENDSPNSSTNIVAGVLIKGDLT